MTLDSNFVLEMAKLGVIALAIIMLSIGVMGGIAFWKTGKGGAGTFSKLFARASVLQMLTVLSIVIAVTFLALTHIIEGSSVVAILSGIAGYVLGGLKAGESSETKNTEKPVGDSITE